MAKVTLLNVNTETAQSILNKTNVPYYGYVNINTNLQIPIKIKYNHTYYKLIGNELVAFRVLAQSLGRNGISQLIQTTDGNISWKLNYWGFCGYDTNEDNKIFASVEDYIKYLETNDYKLIANNNHCSCFCESIFSDFEGRVYDRFRDSIYCKHTYYMRNGVVENDKSLIEHILFNEQGVFLFLEHCEGFESREKAVNSLLNKVVVTDFKETTINLNIEIKETSEQKYKIQLL